MLHQFLPEKLQSWPPNPYNRLSSPSGVPDCHRLFYVSVFLFLNLNRQVCLFVFAVYPLNQTSQYLPELDTNAGGLLCFFLSKDQFPPCGSNRDKYGEQVRMMKMNCLGQL